MKKTFSEILLQDENEIKLARVLTTFDLPFRKYPHFGTWSYLLNSNDGIIVFDTGPHFNSFLIRTEKNKTNNANKIIETIQKYFPNKTVREIIISHYHYDHSECAPELQKKVFEQFGNTPPIRIHIEDSGDKKLLKVFNSSLKKVFNNAGFKKWTMGDFVEHNEEIKGTNFKIKHTPGHTHGNISLVNKKDKIAIIGWWAKDLYHPILSAIPCYLLNEDGSSMPKTIQKIQSKYKDFTLYYYHPVIDTVFTPNINK